jgi:TolB-like protein/DNA-binding winged helix-turn-helix (wHTH) protein
MDLAQQAQFTLGRLTVLPPTCEAVWPDGKRTLQPRVMQVLVTLAQAAGRVVSRRELIDQCWDGRIVGQDAITRVMVDLRRLGHEGGAFELETIPRVGYRLTPAGGVRVRPAPGAIWPGRRAVLAGGGLAALGVAAAGSWTAYRAWRRAGAGIEPLTVAVTPFDNLSPDAADGYLARGATRQVRDTISRVAGLRVIADTSSERNAASLRELGETLGADLLLGGSVATSGDKARISLDLIDPATSAEVWNQIVEGREEDLFGLLDAASGAAIQAMVARVGPDRIRRLPPPRRRDPQAFQLVLQAGDLLERSRSLRMGGKEDEGQAAAERAKGLIDQALAIDPSDVPARVALATIVRNGWTRELAAQALSPNRRAADAAAIVRQALVSDPNDPAALTALGDYYRRFEWRWAEAETLFRRALAANPSLPEARWSYGYELGVIGRSKDGLVQARELFRIDPVNLWRRVALARLLYTSGERDAALARYDIELAADPGNAFLVREIYLMHLAEANAARLKRLAAAVARLWSGRTLPPAVAALLPRIGAGVAALDGAPAALIAMTDADVAAYDGAGTKIAATREGRASVDLLYIYAMEYAWAGAVEKALDLLGRALAAGSLYWPATLPYGPAEFPKPVREHPRYAALWAGDPRLVELMKLRRAASKAGQTAGPWVRTSDWGG